MNTHPQLTTPDLLSLLRLVESAPASGDLAWSEHCTRQQAMILLLQSPGGHVTDTSALTATTGIPIDLIDDIPVPGVAFPTSDGWRIHVAASLSPEDRLRTALHELKHVLDHPIRIRGSNGLSRADYEHLADYFANCVLAEVHP